MNIKKQIQYWNDFSGEFHHPLDINIFESLVKKNEKILDIGCGYGRLMGELRKIGYQDIVGIDSSDKMLLKAKSYHTDLIFHKANAISDINLLFDAESFNVTLLFAFLTCIVNDRDIRTLLRKIYDITKPGGILYISDRQLQNDSLNRGRYRLGKYEHLIDGVFTNSHGIVFRHFDIVEWIPSIVDGFEKIYFTEIDIVSTKGLPEKAFQFIGRKKS